MKHLLVKALIENFKVVKNCAVSFDVKSLCVLGTKALLTLCNWAKIGVITHEAKSDMGKQRKFCY